MSYSYEAEAALYRLRRSEFVFNRERELGFDLCDIEDEVCAIFGEAAPRLRAAILLLDEVSSSQSTGIGEWYPEHYVVGALSAGVRPAEELLERVVIAHAALSFCWILGPGDEGLPGMVPFWIERRDEIPGSIDECIEIVQEALSHQG